MYAIVKTANTKIGDYETKIYDLPKYKDKHNNPVFSRLLVVSNKHESYIGVTTGYKSGRTPMRLDDYIDKI